MREIKELVAWLREEAPWAIGHIVKRVGSEEHQALAVKELMQKCSDAADIIQSQAEAIAAWNRRASPEPWGWICNGKGDGWEEKDKVVRDPILIARYREQPDRWRIEPLYLQGEQNG